MKKGDTVRLSKNDPNAETAEIREDSMVFGASDIGNVRGTNEDSYAIVEKGGKLLFAVFDGMGGMEKGEVASRMASETLVEKANESANWAGFDLLRNILEEANRRIYEFSRGMGSEGKVGTTGAIALIADSTFYGANVGDSRIYLLRKDHLEQISKDHTLVAEQIEKGLITPEEAETSALKNVLTRAIGVREKVEPQFYGPLHLSGDEGFLLCSDGLYNMVDHHTIEAVVAERHSSLQERVNRLISLAKENGGLDNITVVLFDPLARSSRTSRRKTGVFLLVIMLLILVAAALVLWLWFQGWIGVRGIR